MAYKVETDSRSHGVTGFDYPTRVANLLNMRTGIDGLQLVSCLPEDDGVMFIFKGDEK